LPVQIWSDDEIERTQNEFKGVLEFVVSIVSDPLDWIITGKTCIQGDCSPTSILFAFVPWVPGTAARVIGKSGDDITDFVRGAVKNPDAPIAVIWTTRDLYHEVGEKLGETYLYVDRFTDFIKNMIMIHFGMISMHRT
jgi:hypothetical protein